MITIRRTGEKVTLKEFWKRWKQGMNEITPLQQCQINQLGYITIFVGVIWGIIFSAKLKQWWLVIVLSGSLIVSSTAFLSNWQKKCILKKIDKEIKGIENGL
jgi:hypothetical protein